MSHLRLFISKYGLACGDYQCEVDIEMTLNHNG